MASEKKLKWECPMAIDCLHDVSRSSLSASHLAPWVVHHHRSQSHGDQSLYRGMACCGYLFDERGVDGGVPLFGGADAILPS